jgi:hypothetical protein
VRKVSQWRRPHRNSRWGQYTSQTLPMAMATGRPRCRRSRRRRNTNEYIRHAFHAGDGRLNATWEVSTIPAIHRAYDADERVDIDVDQDYLIRNGRKRLHSNDSGSEPPPTFVSHSATRLPPVWAGSHSPPLAPLTPGGHIGRTQPLRRPGHSDTPSRSNGDDSNVRMENPEAQDVMRREVYGPHDALDLLYKAATDRYVTRLPHVHC